MDTDSIDDRHAKMSFISKGSTFDFESFVRETRLYYGNIVYGVEAFKGKVVMICGFSLPLRDENSAVAQAVLLASSELRAISSAFQLVLLIDVSSYGDSDQGMHAFNDFLSNFSSTVLAAPLWEHSSINKYLNLIPASKPTGLLVNRNQIVEWHKPLDFLLEYGADAYPFTSERLDAIREREKLFKSRKDWNPIQIFLSCDPLPSPKFASFLPKNTGEPPFKLDMCGFDNGYTRIGLYLCQTGKFIPTLNEIHKECLALGLEFEIVLVYMPFKDFEPPKSFLERINSTLQNQNISWGVLPFVNWVSRRLWRLSDKDADDRLFIIDPKSKCVELHGETAIRHYGITGHPLSTAPLLYNKSEALRVLTLESLLVHRSRDTVLWMGSDFTYPLPLSLLKRKIVLLYLHYASDHSDYFIERFTSFCQKKAQDPNFEVVFLDLDTTSSSCSVRSSGMPWLVCRLDREHSDFVTRKIFREGSKCSILVTFGKDGRICSARPQQLILSSCRDFPFNDNLHNERSGELFGKMVPYRDSQSSVHLSAENTLNVLLPLLGKEYFFPNIPLGGMFNSPEMQDDMYDLVDEDGRGQCFASRHFCGLNGVGQFPNEIKAKIPNIDPTNFDVVSFLSTDTRRYLLCNDLAESKFHVEDLGDKEWVMICCFFCPVYSSSGESLACRAVSNVCSELYDKFGDSFEMVLVLKMVMDFQLDDSAFRHMLSGFPSSCLVVPFSDSESCDSICRSLAFPTLPAGILLHVNERKVIWHDNLGQFQDYGVDLFPFTDEVVMRIAKEERSLSWEKRSLEYLLPCSPSTVLSRKSPEVSDSFETTTIEKLQGKLVGVYLCKDGDSIPVLQELCERCKAVNMAFEVVVVHFPFRSENSDPKLFEMQINCALDERNVSWWVFPFRNSVSIRLLRLSNFGNEEELIIVGKGHADPDATCFIRELKRSRSYAECNLLKEKVIDKFKLRYQKWLRGDNVAPHTTEEHWTISQRNRYHKDQHLHQRKSKRYHKDQDHHQHTSKRYRKDQDHHQHKSKRYHKDQHLHQRKSMRNHKDQDLHQIYQVSMSASARAM